MSLLTIIIVSFGVAMDAMAVSFSCGITINKNKKIISALKLGIAFGFFQILMPVIGWAIGSQVRVYIDSFDHWIAFIILAIIGIKMIYEAIYKKDECKTINIDNIKILLLLAIATSIDALMVGVGFSLLNVNIIFPVISMGLITFILSFTGTIIGDKLGNRFGKHIEVFGGLILIAIGLKIFLEHVL